MDDGAVEYTRGSFTISTDRTRVTLDALVELLRTKPAGPWLDREVLRRAVRHSLCFGCYHGNRLIGFGRVVTDRATYAYWTDIVVAAEYRGNGLGLWLTQCMLQHPDLQGLRRIALLTKSAASLYTRLGFSADVGRLQYMELRADNEDVT